MFEVLKQDLGVKTKLPEVSRSCPGIAPGDLLKIIWLLFNRRISWEYLLHRRCPGIAPSDLFNIFNPDGKSNFEAFKAGRIESLEYVQSLKMNAETVATTCMRAWEKQIFGFFVFGKKFTGSTDSNL